MAAKFPNLPIVRSALVVLALMTAGLAGAQTNGSALAAATPQAKPAAQGAGAATPSATHKSPETAQAAVPATPPLAATNAEPTQAGKQLQSQPQHPFPEVVPELAVSQPQANEMAVGRFTLSGIAIQIVKAKNPLQLVNPAAPPDYGSGVDNVEWFSTSPNGPTLKLFSINF